MTVSFQTTNFNSINTIKKNNNSKTISFGLFPTPQTIERDRRIKRDNIITMVAGTGIGATVGCLKYTNKLKAGIIGGLLGLVAGRIVGFLIHPYIHRD